MNTTLTDDTDPERLRALQKELASQVVRTDAFERISTIAGVDVAYSSGDYLHVAAAVALDAATLEPIETTTALVENDFPYIPGLFSFRELPPILAALQKLTNWPDLIICDGHGIAHPQRFGLASHLGIEVDTPTIGCAKTRLIGEFDPVAAERGSTSPLFVENECVGHVLRTQSDIKPLFISLGHRISLATSCDWVLHAAQSYRQPETTRLADQEVRKILKQRGNALRHRDGKDSPTP